MNNELSRSMQMFRVMDRMRRAWMEITPMQEMSKSQFNTLMMLRHGVAEHHQGEEQKLCEPMTLSELSSKLGQSMPAVSQRISKLESMGYVQRSPDLKDKRTTWICLTDAGEKLLQNSCHLMAQKLESIMEQMGQEDTQTMFRVLEKLAGIMEQSADKSES